MKTEYTIRTLLVSLVLLATPLVARVEPTDFTYLGSFDITCSETWCTYGQRGLSLADGGSALWITGHDDDAQVVKISIPPIGGSAQKLSGPINFLNCPEQSYSDFAGVEMAGGVLRGTCKYWYNVEQAILDTYHSAPGAAAQHIGPTSSPFNQGKMGAYLFGVPPDFAAQHLDGKDLITGYARPAGAFGGSQGPTLMAFDSGNPSDALDLVWYRQRSPECGDDDAFCDFTGYRSDDFWEGATWVRSAAGDAILIAGSKGLGPNYYGVARPGDCSPYSGYHADPYEVQILFYDPQDIVARLQGSKEPWEVLPYDHATISGTGGIGECTALGGMTFDQASGRLYVVSEEGAGGGDQPKIHVWQIDAEPPPPPFCGDGTCDVGEDHVSCPTDCEAPPPPPTAGLIAHYALDEGSGTVAWDSSGNGHNGTLVNGPQWFAGMAVEFDGQNDYIDAGGFDVPGSAVSLAAWFKSDDLTNCSSGDCRLISKATSTAEDAHYFMLSTIQEGAFTRLRFRLKTGGVTKTLIASSGNLAAGQWVHAAAVYDGSQMRLYKDGELVGSTSKSGNISTNSSVPVWIGGNPNGASSMPWDGLVDDVRIYDQALTAAEIRALPPPGQHRLFGDNFESANTSAWSSTVQ